MRPRLPILLACLVALSACAGAGSGSPTPTPLESPSVEPTQSPEPSRSLRPGSQQPSRSPADGAELTGTLGADSIEGGCGYLEAEDGTRYQVMYPAGWTLTLSPLALTSPQGEVVARGGDEVTVRGSVADDMASICQIGPIYRATAVLTD